MHDDELIQQAIAKYVRDTGPGFMQPSKGGSFVDDNGDVVLENARGPLVRYRPATDSLGRVTFKLVEDNAPSDG
jgi:hypothetical protein